MALALFYTKHASNAKRPRQLAVFQRLPERLGEDAGP
jgi:hypothetical protein